MGCFPLFEFGSLVSITLKESFNAAAYSDSLDNSMLPILCQHVGESPLLFEHDNAPLHAQVYNGLFVFQFGGDEIQTH